MASSKTPLELVKQTFLSFRQSSIDSNTYSADCMKDSELLESHHLAKTPKEFVFKVKIHPRHLNMGNVVHGGYIATIIDVFTTVTTVGVERPFTPSFSLNLNIEYIKGVRNSDYVFVKCINDKVGRTIVFCSCEVYDQKENLCYKASHVKFKMKPSL